MHVLAMLTGLFSAAAAAASLLTGDNVVMVLAAAGILCAYTTYRSRKISTFLRIFAAIFAAETVIFGVVFLTATAGLWPVSISDYESPVSIPITFATSRLLFYVLS